MKVSKGRGIQFFKQPFFDRPASYVSRAYQVTQKQVTSAYKFVKGKMRREHK